jgi:NAD(P)-dependent dehydrogenase (short-subunit alcohol dehydrogenase family)
LDGRAAIVTGGAGGIGGATARALAREGASVVIVDIDGDRAEQVAEAITASNGTAFSVSADLSEETEVVAAISAAMARYGRLDVLHNNAAMTESDFLSRDTQVTDLPLEVWERTMAINLRSQMLMCKHAVPEMVRDGGGSIISAHLTDHMLAGLGRATLTPYVGEPADVANLVVFLASDESRYITGQMIAIDGGMSAHVGAVGPDDR